MNRAEFEAELRREGYEVSDGAIKPNEHRAAHAHAFDIRLLVLDGSITLVVGNDRCSYGPNDTCHVPAGAMHEEHVGPNGVTYLIGRR
jgi:mannose-6-phosphate isomerase-like protein (cupin superfamily)